MTQMRKLVENSLIVCGITWWTMCIIRGIWHVTLADISRIAKLVPYQLISHLPRSCSDLKTSEIYQYSGTKNTTYQLFSVHSETTHMFWFEILCTIHHIQQNCCIHHSSNNWLCMPVIGMLDSLTQLHSISSVDCLARKYNLIFISWVSPIWIDVISTTIWRPNRVPL